MGSVLSQLSSTMKYIILLSILTIAYGAVLKSSESREFQVIPADTRLSTPERGHIEGETLNREKRQARNRGNCWLQCNKGFYCWEQCSCNSACANTSGFEK